MAYYIILNWQWLFSEQTNDCYDILDFNFGLNQVKVLILLILILGKTK